MYVERIIFSNRAPFESLDLTFEDKSINVLTAINGKGKTTILSYIMDAWVELTKGVYTNSYKGREDSYYRVSSPLYVLDKSKPSLVYIRFAENGKILDYLDIRGSITVEDYDRIVNLDGKIDYQKFGNSNNEIGNKHTSPSSSEEIREWFDENIHTYFPEYRQELPYYLNEKYADDIKYDIDSKFTKNLFTPLEVKTDIHDIANWLMDVLLDCEINNEHGTIVTPELAVWTNIRKVLQQALSGKFPDAKIRLGIGRRSDSGARISVTDYDGEIIYPSIFTLSSGEKAILSIFCELLRQGDVLFNGKNTLEFRGVVLIDEVDKNLHIKLQKEVLPQLFQLFPNIQFILTSHSPFLNMGLAGIAKERSHIVDLDNNGIVSSPESTQLYNEVYEMMLHEKNTFAEEYNKLKIQLSLIQKPLIITEGKTDIKHIRKAFEALNIEQRFAVIPSEKQPDGCSNVQKIIEILCKVVGQPKKVIAIFDRDEPSLLKSYPDPYKDLGNNVYALCIPCPESRKQQGRTYISIEYLYSDDEIHTKLPNGTQLFFGNEFEGDSTKRHKTNPDLRANESHGLGKDKILENNGGQAVYDAQYKNYLAKKDDFAEAVVNGDILISKESWENFRPLIDIINEIIDK